MTVLDYKTMINYVGTYWTEDGTKHETPGMVLEYVDEERQDLSAGLRGDYVLAAPVHKLDGEENIVTVDMHDWVSTACVQNGGHNLVTHQMSEEPGNWIRICTRCGEEVGDPEPKTHADRFVDALKRDWLEGEERIAKSD